VNAGNHANGLFGAVNVEPAGANFYRSQVTEEDMRLATAATTPAGQPVLDYEARYPSAEPWIAEGKANLPILNMLDGTRLVHSDINAVVAFNADGRSSLLRWRASGSGTRRSRTASSRSANTP
jgi:hypothetical protein